MKMDIGHNIFSQKLSNGTAQYPQHDSDRAESKEQDLGIEPGGIYVAVCRVSQLSIPDEHRAVTRAVGRVEADQ